MNNYQITKLQNMLTMLYDNNPYYSKIMKEMDCNPKFDNTLEIYQNMPFMDKATLLAANEEILTGGGSS